MKADSLCIPRKDHRCRLCNELILKGEPCERWTWLVNGIGFGTSHAHPECFAITKNWDSGDWEATSSGDIERPKTASK